MTEKNEALIAELREHADEVHAHSTRGAEVMLEAADALEARQPSEDDLGRIKKIILESLVFVNENSDPWARLLAENILAAVPDAATDKPDPCEMTHTPPFDFAQCETHDTTFPLGGKCKWHGRTSIVEVLQEEIDEQRARAVRAEHERGEADKARHWFEVAHKNHERAEKAEAERDAALAAIERVRAIHVRHKDTHKRDPSVINGNWFCCGAVQLGAVDPCACIACDSSEWPCPTIAALDGAPEPEEKP